MAGNNVIPFPGGSTPGNGFGAAFGVAPDVAADAVAPAQAGAGTPVAPMVDQILARLGTTLSMARRTTLKLVSAAVPGTIEQGLFNQFGIIQNTLAQLGARAAQAPSNEELTAIGQDLEGIEKSTNDYVTAVDSALANAPTIPNAVKDDNRKKLLWIGGALAVAALGTTAYLVLRKPARRRRIAGALGLGAAAAREPAERMPKRKARKLPKSKR